MKDFSYASYELLLKPRASCMQVTFYELRELRVALYENNRELIRVASCIHIKVSRGEINLRVETNKQTKKS